MSDHDLTSEGLSQAEPRHKRPRRCDYICLSGYDHLGTASDHYEAHFMGYEIPSARRYDQAWEWKVGRVRLLWMPKKGEGQ